MISILVASIGNNLKLAEDFEKSLKDLGVDSKIINLVEADLPLYSTAAEKAGKPEQAVEITETLRKSKGAVFVAPEYNGGIPPQLTNLVDGGARCL